MKFQLYGVKNQDGQYFRAKGYGGYGKSWVENAENAKLYSKIGQAKARVTFWTQNYPEYGVPSIVVFEVDELKEIDDSKRQEKIKEQRNISDARVAVRTFQNAKKFAEENLIKAQRELEKYQ
jgi:hypothetical protein